MKYRKYRGLNLSEIGIGCYSLSGVYGKKDITQFKNVINRAYQLGINFFDTADAYGDAEEILGAAIKSFRKNVIISTKVGVGDSLKPNLSYEYINTACDKSLKKLNTDYIDIYNVHYNDSETPIEETIAALEGLIVKGKIRNYGVGHLPIDSVKKYLTKGNLSSILMELNAVSLTYDNALWRLCKAHDLGVVAFSVTARGLLTGKFAQNSKFSKDDIRNIDPQFQRERFQHGLRVVEKITEIGKRLAKTPVQIAIAWVLSHPEVTTALTGPGKIEHLEENVAGSGWDFSEAELTELNHFLRQEEKWLKKEQTESLKVLLNHPLSGDVQAAFVNLLYVFETAMTLGLVKEDEIISVCLQLYGLKNQLEVINIGKLEEIREKASAIIKIN